VISPCVKVCVMDAERRYCAGCLRTLDEIARWGTMSDQERAEVLARLPARRSDVAEVPAAPLA
jgi:uncharacterized protein